MVGTFLLGLIIGLAGNPNANTSSNSAGSGGTSVSTAPPAPAGPAATMGSGTYQVGVDIQPGQYKTDGPKDLPCYWARRKDDSGAFESIIANGNLDGPGSVTINQGEFIELSGDCTWAKVG